MGIVKTSHPPFLFTTEQYDGLLAASLSATLISLLASFVGLIVHFLLLWYDHHRPNNENYSMSTSKLDSKISSLPTCKDIGKTHMNQHYSMNSSPTYRHCGDFKKGGSSTGAMNRVSLRLIVLACISFSIYSISQIIIIVIPEKVLGCRILAYFIICFDIMGNLSLGLVGFNLVLVFVVNVKHPERFEKYYYGVTLLSAIFVIVPPLVLRAGRTIDENDSCWYHFFFEGRVVNTFNWIYYYSWLLFASILASVTSIIAIRKVILEKNNFAHTINMLNREEISYPRPGISTDGFVTTKSSQTDLFRKVAIRCICYALVPVLCKSWGIGIEIAISSGIVVNYPILVIDRFMACIMGFFVSCIYFSDPSVRMVWHDMMNDYKKRYVDQFYYVDITKVIPLERHQQNQPTTFTIINFSYSTTNKRVKSTSVPDPVYIYDYALRSPMKYHPPTNILYYLFKSSNHIKNGNNTKWVPMRRIDIPIYRPSDSQQFIIPRDNQFLEPYCHPKLAKFVYWFFVHLLFYRPPYYYQQKRAFEIRKGKGKGKGKLQSIDHSFSENETTTDDSNNQSKPDNIIKIITPERESIVLSSTSSSVSQSEQKTTIYYSQDKMPHPLLQQPESRNRPISTSIIPFNQEKEKIGKQSSSIELDSMNRPTPSKMKKDTFLSQKLPYERVPEYPSYRHIPAIGNLMKSVSPVHSFMSVRRAAASSFRHTQGTRPSSLISGSSSPVAVSSLSLSSSSLSPLSSSSSSSPSPSFSSTSSLPLNHARQRNTTYTNQATETCGKNEKALSIECINNYHRSSTISCEEMMVCQQQQSFFTKDGGLSPPSKQHYAFIYYQDEKIASFNKSAKKNTHNIQTDKEILFSGVRTIVLHIKNDMDIDNHQQGKKKHRIDFFISNWEGISTS